MERRSMTDMPSRKRLSRSEQRASLAHARCLQAFLALQELASNSINAIQRESSAMDRSLEDAGQRGRSRGCHLATSPARK